MKNRLVICFLNKLFKDITPPTFLMCRDHFPLLVSGVMWHPTIELYPLVLCPDAEFQATISFLLKWWSKIWPLVALRGDLFLNDSSVEILGR